MWILSKQLKKSGLSHAQLESLVSQRTIALQNFSQRLLKVQDEERRRVARDLHDSTGQTLAALKMGIAVLEERLKQNRCTSDVLSEIAALADQAIQEIRTTSYLLHPPLLDEAGFNSAAQWYVDGFGKRSGIKVRLDLATKRERLPITIETALFRVLQESLTNVYRHSGALEVSIRFQYQAETVLLEIRDCGRGIPIERLTRLREANSETGVGLAGMRERLTELNGKLEIESDRHGTSLRAIVPLPFVAPSVPHENSTKLAFDCETTADALLTVSTTGLASSSGTLRKGSDTPFVQAMVSG
jgi:two-component system, NarL family, sensor kinase